MSMTSEEPSPFRPDLQSGKVALVTGGSSGIGFEIARQLGLHGAKVIISGRRQQVLDDACAALGHDGIQALGVQGDVRKPDNCQEWIKQGVAKFGRLDILVNCAAGNFLVPAEQLSPNAFKTVMEIDTQGTFNASRASFPELEKSGDAAIVNISATLQYGATWYQAHASAAKAAVDSLTRSLALEWGHFHIRVNGIAPGPISGTAGMTKLFAGGDDAMQHYMKTIPLGRLGTKWDIAMAVNYLCSSAARYVTGATLVVDGGEWMYRPPLIPREAVSQASRGLESKSRATGHAGDKRSKL
ncbi:hypothetical protein WJX74_000456 [Apatococcus lobatus]|uniref:2,4-dienoyl-CoA reductase [(3E)-enoyl-CoA-producing] n=1 Tax=Apatococcus lobatus TaxID=904363 RepID=A0AAW1Q989_9CHLO